MTIRYLLISFIILCTYQVFSVTDTANIKYPDEILTTLTKLEENLNLIEKDSAVVQEELNANLLILLEHGFTDEVIDYIKNFRPDRLMKANPFKLIEYCDNFKGIVEESQNDTIIFTIENNIGSCYYYLGDYTQALEQYFKALNMGIKINDSLQISISYHNIGEAFRMLKSYKKSIEYLNKSAEINENLKKTEWLGSNYNSLAICLYYLQDTIQSLKLFKKSLTMFKQLHDQEMAMKLQSNIALLYIEIGDFKGAKPYLDAGRQIALDFNHADGLASSDLAFGKYYYYQNNLNKALQYQQNALKIANKNNLIERRREVLGELSNTYSSLNNFPKAFEAYQAFNQIDDSLKALQNLKSLTQAEMQFKFEKDMLIKEAEFELREQIVNKRMMVISFISIILLLASTTFLFLFLYQRQRSKIYELSERNLKIQKENLVREIEGKNKELTSKVMFIIKKNELITNILDRLKNMKGQAKPTNQKQLINIINDLEKTTYNEGWEEFEKRFQDVYTDFYEKLYAEFPDLTPNERKICAFLKLNMSSKEISAITRQTVGTINMARYRLRKRMDLDRDDNLINYLQSL